MNPGCKVKIPWWHWLIWCCQARTWRTRLVWIHFTSQCISSSSSSPLPKLLHILTFTLGHGQRNDWNRKLDWFSRSHFGNAATVDALQSGSQVCFLSIHFKIHFYFCTKKAPRLPVLRKINTMIIYQNCNLVANEQNIFQKYLEALESCLHPKTFNSSENNLEKNAIILWKMGIIHGNIITVLAPLGR